MKDGFFRIDGIEFNDILEAMEHIDRNYNNGSNVYIEKITPVFNEYGEESEEVITVAYRVVKIDVCSIARSGVEKMMESRWN